MFSSSETTIPSERPYYLRVWHRLIGVKDLLHLAAVSSHRDRPSLFKMHTHCCLALPQMLSTYFIPVCLFPQNRFLELRLGEQQAAQSQYKSF